MIEHLVLSGGANIGFAFFGTLKQLILDNYLQIENIKTIHATSIGACIASFITLGYDLETVETYLIDRPWKDIYKFDFQTVIEAFQEGGFFDIESIKQTAKPLLLGKDLSLDITLEEYYEYNKKELHFYTTEYSQLSLVDISYKTHPKWKLVEAIYASCCLPVLMRPLYKDDEFYVDGAVLLNYPLIKALETIEDSNTILGIYHDTNKDISNLRKAKPFNDEPSNYRLMEYMMSILLKMWTIVKHEKKQKEKEHLFQIGIKCNTNALYIIKAFECKEERIQLLELGKNSALEYLKSIQNIYEKV